MFRRNFISSIASFPIFSKWFPIKESFDMKEIESKNNEIITVEKYKMFEFSEEFRLAIEKDVRNWLLNSNPEEDRLEISLSDKHTNQRFDFVFNKYTINLRKARNSWEVWKVASCSNYDRLISCLCPINHLINEEYEPHVYENRYVTLNHMPDDFNMQNEVLPQNF